MSAAQPNQTGIGAIASVRQSEEFRMLADGLQAEPSAVERGIDGTWIVVFEEQRTYERNAPMVDFLSFVVFSVKSNHVYEVVQGEPDVLRSQVRLVDLRTSATTTVANAALRETARASSRLGTQAATCSWCGQWKYIPGHFSDKNAYNQCKAACAITYPLGGKAKVICNAVCFAAYWVPGHNECVKWYYGPPCPN